MRMKTTAVRIHGVRDLRMDTFELPEIREDEILARIVTDSLCLSTYKVAQKGSAHKKLPENLEENPVIMGHEFCGRWEKNGKINTSREISLWRSLIWGEPIHFLWDIPSRM
mgnify:CR=1 FL=1